MTAPPELRALASRALGVSDMFSWTCLKDHAQGAAVWLAQTPGASLVIKQHRHPRAFAHELRAYREWLPRLALARASAASGPRAADDALPACAPALLAFDAPARALALTCAPGAKLPAAPRDALARDPDPLSRATPSTSDLSLATSAHRDPDLSRATPASPSDLSLATSAHRAAGRFARALHALAVADDDPVPLADAISARLDAWHARAGDLLAPSERTALARLAARRDAFASCARVACHRDYTPDNWLSDGTSLVILDFEHARLDAPEADLVKLRAEVWPAASALQAAFLAGYGPLDVDARARLDVLLALHAVATLAWARRHRDAAFTALGRRALAVALASP